MNAKVFISHSSVDQKVAKTICTALEHRGLACWMASRDVGPGQNYMDAIVRAIRDAKVMVLVFSQNANISGEILKELSLASKYKLNVIPARIEDVVPSEAFELEFATRQWIDLFENWELEIERLTSWIISIVPVEPKTDAAAKRAEDAAPPGAPPIPRSPPDAAIQSPAVAATEDLRPSEAEADRRADEERSEAEARRRAEDDERRAKEDRANEEKERERQQQAEVQRRADERRKQADAEARRQAEDERRAEETETKRRAEQEQALAAAKRSDTVGTPADAASPPLQPSQPAGRPSTRALAIGGAFVAGVALVGWVVTTQRTPVATAPLAPVALAPVAVAPPAVAPPAAAPSPTDQAAEPKDAVGYAIRGNDYLGKGDFDRAIADYDQAIRLDAKVSSTYYNRGSAYLGKGDYDRAIKDYSQAILLDTKDASNYTARGNVYAFTGDYDRAIADYNQAIQLDPKSASTYNSRGNAYVGKGDYDRAIKDFSQAIQLDPKLASAYNGRGESYRHKGEHDRAIKDYNQAILLDPKEAAAYIGRGVAYADKGDYDRAVADYTQAIQLDPKSSAAYFSRGRLNLYAGDLPKALADLNNASELEPKDAYNALWLDIIGQRNNVPSRLSQAVGKIDMTAWPAPVIRLFLGETTAVAALGAADHPDAKKKKGQVCEVNFYSGQLALRTGAKDEATRLFRLAAKDCPKTFVEWSAAKAELKALGVAL